LNIYITNRSTKDMYSLHVQNLLHQNDYTRYHQNNLKTGRHITCLI